MSDLTKLSAGKLHAEIAKRSAAHMRNIDAMIASGYGHCRGSDIREFAKGSSLLGRNLLARAWCETRDAEQAARDELDARKRYQGNDKPIKRAV